MIRNLHLHLHSSEQEERLKELKQYPRAWEMLLESLHHSFDKTPEWPDYDKPQWAYEQAHRNGMRKATKDLIDVLERLVNT